MKTNYIENSYSIHQIKSIDPQKTVKKWLIYLLIAFFVCMFLPWQQNIKSTGFVTGLNPAERPQSIVSVLAGRIERWNVIEGQFVKMGDTIAIISEVKDKFFDPKIIDRLGQQINSKSLAIKSKADKATSLENQIKAMRQALILDLQKAGNSVTQGKVKVQSDSAEFSAARVDVNIAKQQYQRQDELYKQGLKSLTDLEKRQLTYQKSLAEVLSKENKLIDSQNELINKQIELSALQAKYMEKITKAESDLNATLADLYESEADLAKLEIEFANIKIRSNLYIIRAPQNGFIVKAQVSGIGETVKEGQELITIVPEKPKKAIELYIKPLDAAIVKIGTPVRIQFDGWPALVFSGWPNTSVGTFGGKIAVIDNAISKGGKYRILVVPDENDEPWPEEIRMGTGAYGWNMLNIVPLWYEIWRQFNGFPVDIVYNDDNQPLDFNQDKKESKEDNEKKDEEK
jgi:multidrug resistance efflux pump